MSRNGMPLFRAVIRYERGGKTRYLVKLSDSEEDAKAYAETFDGDPKATWRIRDNGDVYAKLMRTTCFSKARAIDILDCMWFGDGDILGDDSTMTVACVEFGEQGVRRFNWRSKRQLAKWVGKRSDYEDIGILAIDLVNGRVYEKGEGSLDLITL